MKRSARKGAVRLPTSTKLIVAMLMGWLGGCAERRLTTAAAERSPDWFHAPSPSPRGVFLVMEGLNSRSSILDPLRRELGRLGFHSLRQPLPGNDGEEPGPSKELWVEAVRHGVASIRRFSPEGEIRYLGYSSGAVAMLLALATTPDLPVDGLFLIAPPLALRPASSLLRPLLPLRRLGLVLPSFAPRSYRARPFTSLESYAALFSVIDELSVKEPPRKLHTIPAIVALAEDDEFVDNEGVVKWLLERNLHSWHIERMRSAPSTPRHLIVDEATLGAEEWSRLVGSLARFVDR